LYEEWVENFNICPILNVPADDLDFVKRPEHLKLIKINTNSLDFVGRNKDLEYIINEIYKEDS